MSETKCSVNNGYYPTVSAFEHANSQRTQVNPCSNTVKLQALLNKEPFDVKIDKIYGENGQILYGGWNCITRDSDELFILGGCNGRDNPPYQAYVQKIKLNKDKTMVADGDKLLLGNDDSSYWNYPGSLVAHQNGYLYVIFGYQLAKINPDTMIVVDQIDLPPDDDQQKNTCYNGVLILDNGDLAMKNLYRKDGCTEDGALAFFKCDQETTRPSNIVIVDPGNDLTQDNSSMFIKAQTTSENTLGGRLTATLQKQDSDGNPLYYLFSSTEDNVYRYDYYPDDQNLVRNSNWIVENYRKNKNETTASAFAIMGNYVVAQTNALPTVGAPMQIIVVDINDSDKNWAYTPFGIGFSGSFAALTVLNEDNKNYIYCYDGLAKRIAAYQFDDTKTGDDAFNQLWQVKKSTTTFLSVVGAPGKHVMIHTEVLDSFPHALLLTELFLGLFILISVLSSKSSLGKSFVTGITITAGIIIFIGLTIMLLNYILPQTTPYLALYGSNHTQEKMYWRDLQTGEELAVSEPFDTGAGLEISPGFNTVAFYPTVSDTVLRFSLTYQN